jgi:hypothetical protein
MSSFYLVALRSSDVEPSLAPNPERTHSRRVAATRSDFLSSSSSSEDHPGHFPRRQASDEQLRENHDFLAGYRHWRQALPSDDPLGLDHLDERRASAKDDKAKHQGPPARRAVHAW